jgi:hypothetical protein
MEPGGIAAAHYADPILNQQAVAPYRPVENADDARPASGTRTQQSLQPELQSSWVSRPPAAFGAGGNPAGGSVRHFLSLGMS